MKILIAASIQGDSGYEEKELTSKLLSTLKDMGHIVDFFYMPYQRDMLALPEQVVAYQLFQIEQADMLVTLGYPACFLRHKNKRCFLFQTAPMIAEYYGSEFGVLDNRQYQNIQKSMFSADKIELLEAKCVIVNSNILKDDLLGRCGLDAKVCYIPNLFSGIHIGNIPNCNYVVAETDLLPEGRYELILEAISMLEEVKLILFVPRTMSMYKDTLNQYINEFALSKKVEVSYSICSSDIMKSAKCYITAGYNKRKISNAIPRAIENNIPIIATDDGAAEVELLNDSNCFVAKPNAKSISSMLENILKNDKAVHCSSSRLISMRNFAEQLVR